MERKTDDDLEHSREQIGQNTPERMTQAKHTGSEYNDEATRNVPGYTDLARTMSSEQNFAGYDTLQDQNNGYTELRKSIVTKDQYDTLGEHHIYDYSTVSVSTTNTKAIIADRENGVDCSRDRENISETSGHEYRNIDKTNLKYYNEQLHISTGNKHSLDASESGIRKQKSVESIGNNEPDYSYVSGFKDRQNDTKHVQGMVQSLNKDFVPASQDNDVHQDMQREECVSERTNKSNRIQAVSPRAWLIGVAIVVLAVFVGCLVLVLSLEEKSQNSRNSSDKDLFQDYKIVQRRIDALENDNKALKVELAQIKDCQCSNRKTTPVFSSVLTHPLNVTSNAAIKFNRVIVNIKDGYDPTSGIFTAPSKGVYHISSTVMNADGKKLSVSLYLNDVKITSIYLNPASKTFEMGTTNMMLDLKEGDKVTMRSRGSYTVHSNQNVYSSFSGYLIMN
ncbi:uncharacterized protein [Mytilus edulis]|uniref:uncharacterized protein n=1 Tax=Mytilus edulis TaxID=6550 RepID=UPI0039F02575